MITGPQLAKILGVSRAYIHRLTVRGAISATDVSAPGAKRKRFLYSDAVVARLRKNGLPRKRKK